MRSIRQDLSELRENSSKLKTELVVTKQVNNVLHSQMVQVKRKSWSNEQYSRCECLEIVGITESLKHSSLEETALKTFKELGISIDISDMEACHSVGPPSRKNVIVKMSGQKDSDRVRQVKNP